MVVHVVTNLLYYEHWTDQIFHFLKDFQRLIYSQINEYIEPFLSKVQTEIIDFAKAIIHNIIKLDKGI